MSKHDEIMAILEKLCYSESEQIALKACIEMLQRSEQKSDVKCLYWFTEDECPTKDEA